MRMSKRFYKRHPTRSPKSMHEVLASPVITWRHDEPEKGAAIPHPRLFFRADDGLHIVLEFQDATDLLKLFRVLQGMLESIQQHQERGGS